MVMITTEGINKIIDEIIKTIKNIDVNKVSAEKLREYFWKVIKQNAFHDDDKWVKK